MPSNDESTTAFGRVVDDEVDAGQVLERADVAALPADDPPLHVVRGKLDERHRRLGGSARRDPLQSVGDEVARPALGLGLRLLLELAHTAGELVAHLLLRLGEDPLPRLARRHRRRSARAPGGGAILELLHLLLQLPQVDLAVGDSLLAPRQLGQLPVDVVLLRDDALLDLQHRVAALAQLRLELGPQLDRLLADLDRRLAPRCVRLAASLVEEQRTACAARRRAATGAEPEREQRRACAGCESDHDCQGNEHGRSYGLCSPHGARPRRSALPGAVAPRPACQFSVSARVGFLRCAGGSSTEFEDEVIGS